jgi:23S rRNA (uracil1939-C5)-methyltransferase
MDTMVIPPDIFWLEVESLDLEAQGVAHRADGKVVFIEGALPGERVQVQVSRKKNNWEQGPMSAWRARARSACARAARTSGCTPAPAAAARCSTCTRRRRWR